MATAGLWAINAVLAALSIGFAWRVFDARRARTRHIAAEQQTEVAQSVIQRGDPSVALAAWEAILERPPGSGKWPSSRRLIARLCDCDPERREALRKAAEPLVEHYNDVASAVDDGLVEPLGFIRSYPDLHLVMLKELALLEPFIWFESVISGRGRWGYGPLHLQSVLRDLRALSDDDDVREPIRIALCDQLLEILPALTKRERVIERVKRSIARPKINVRTKMRQRRRSRELADQLRADGYDAIDLFHVGKAIDW